MGDELTQVGRVSIVGSVVECSPATRAARVRFPDDAVTFVAIFTCQHWGKNCGGAGYRSRYLSHAKRALYHLSYAPHHAGLGCRVDIYHR